MSYLPEIFIGLVALIHLYIAYFEMFAWTSRGPKVFKSFSKDLFPQTKSMAFNQGLYNAFLALGLLWSLIIKDPTWSYNVATFFLGCVVVAGVVGALTAEKKIFLVQSVPALLGLIFIALKNNFL